MSGKTSKEYLERLTTEALQACTRHVSLKKEMQKNQTHVSSLFSIEGN